MIKAITIGGMESRTDGSRLIQSVRIEYSSMHTCTDGQATSADDFVDLTGVDLDLLL